MIKKSLIMLVLVIASDMALSSCSSIRNADVVFSSGMRANVTSITQSNMQNGLFGNEQTLACSANTFGIVMYCSDSVVARHKITSNYNGILINSAYAFTQAPDNAEVKDRVADISIKPLSAYNDAMNANVELADSSTFMLYNNFTSKADIYAGKTAMITAINKLFAEQAGYKSQVEMAIPRIVAQPKQLAKVGNSVGFMVRITLANGRVISDDVPAITFN
jgi:hypothetical protein